MDRKPHNFVITIPLLTSKVLRDKVQNDQSRIIAHSPELRQYKVSHLSIRLVSLCIENDSVNSQELTEIINAVHKTKTEYNLFQSEHEDVKQKEDQCYQLHFKTGCYKADRRGIFIEPTEKDKEHLHYIAEHLSNCLADINVDVSVRETYEPKLYLFEDPRNVTSFYGRKKLFWKKFFGDFMDIKAFNLTKLSTMETVATFDKTSIFYL